MNTFFKVLLALTLFDTSAQALVHRHGQGGGGWSGGGGGGGPTFNGYTPEQLAQMNRKRSQPAASAAPVITRWSSYAPPSQAFVAYQKGMDDAFREDCKKNPPPADPNPENTRMMEILRKEIGSNVSTARENLGVSSVTSQLSPQAVKYLKNELGQIEKDSAAVISSMQQYREHNVNPYQQIAVKVTTDHELGVVLLDYANAKAQSIAHFTGGLAKGFHKGFYDAAQTIKMVYDNPLVVAQISRSIMHAATDPAEFYRDAKRIPGRFFNHTKGAFLEFCAGYHYGDATRKGEIIGELASNILTGMALGNAKLGATPAVINPIKVMIEDIRKHNLGEAIAKNIMPEIRQTLKSDLDAVRKVVKAEREVLSGWSKHNRITGWESSETANAKFVKKHPGWLPPHLPHSQVILHHPKGDSTNRYVMLHQEGQISNWVVEKTAIDGLTPAQLQLKYSLPKPPVYVSDAQIPAKTPMSYSRTGYLNLDPNLEPLAHEMQKQVEGAVQHEILIPVDKTWFKNRRKL